MRVKHCCGRPAAAPHGRSGRSTVASRLPLLLGAFPLLVAAGAVVPSTAAFAQAAFSLTAETDFRFRGASLSGRRPVATAQFSYDHVSGLYLNTSATGISRRGDADLLNVLANIGYARRLNSSVSVDAGLVHSRYRWGDVPNPSSARTEAYVGATVKDVAARLSWSPRYFERGISILYGELEAGFQPHRNWRFTAHAGLLAFLRAPGALDGTTRYDWRLGVSRQLGRVELHTALFGGGPDRGSHGATAVTAGASLNF